MRNPFMNCDRPTNQRIDRRTDSKGIIRKLNFQQYTKKNFHYFDTALYRKFIENYRKFTSVSEIYEFVCF